MSNSYNRVYLASAIAYSHIHSQGTLDTLGKSGEIQSIVEVLKNAR